MAEYHCSQAILLAVIGVSRQAYSKWRHRQPSKREAFNQLLEQKLIALDKQHRHTFGSRQFVINLNLDPEVTEHVGRRRVARLMRKLNIQCCVRIKKHDRLKQAEQHIKDNVLAQNFSQAKQPDEVWLSDFTQLTYGPHGEYSVKLSGVLDVYSGYLVAHNISATETTAAAVQTFQRAFKATGNPHPLVHTDRGSAYVSGDFNDFMFQHDVKRSMSRPGTPYDNSLMERYWNEFKVSWIRTHPRPTTYRELEALIESGITYFNAERRSAKRNGLTPEEYRNKAIPKRITA